MGRKRQKPRNQESPAPTPGLFFVVLLLFDHADGRAFVKPSLSRRLPLGLGDR